MIALLLCCQRSPFLFQQGTLASKELNSAYLANSVFWVLVVNLKLIPSESSFINVPEQTNLRRVYLHARGTFLQDAGIGLTDFCHLCLLLLYNYYFFTFFSSAIRLAESRWGAFTLQISAGHSSSAYSPESSVTFDQYLLCHEDGETASSLYGREARASRGEGSSPKSHSRLMPKAWLGNQVSWLQTLCSF